VVKHEITKPASVPPELEEQGLLRPGIVAKEDL